MGGSICHERALHGLRAELCGTEAEDAELEETEDRTAHDQPQSAAMAAWAGSDGEWKGDLEAEGWMNSASTISIGWFTLSGPDRE